MTWCSCNNFSDVGSGGLAFGGSSPLTSTAAEGGVTFGGSALVDLVQIPYDGLIALWSLGEDGDGTPDEYEDRGPNLLHGTGGLVVPAIDDGVFCLPSQRFEEGDGQGSFIDLPADTLREEQAFSVSCWTKISDEYKPRSLYSRGFVDTEGNTWLFSLGYGWLRHVTATIQLVSGDETVTYEAFSDVTLQRDRWYHVAATWEPGVGLTCFVDGEAGTLYEVAETVTVTQGNGGYFGRFNLGSYPTGNLQEVRLFPEVRDEVWFTAEKDNFCLDGFFTVGPEESVVTAED